MNRSSCPPGRSSTRTPAATGPLVLLHGLMMDGSLWDG